MQAWKSGSTLTVAPPRTPDQRHWCQGLARQHPTPKPVLPSSVCNKKGGAGLPALHYRPTMRLALATEGPHPMSTLPSCTGIHQDMAPAPAELDSCGYSGGIVQTQLHLAHGDHRN